MKKKRPAHSKDQLSIKNKRKTMEKSDLVEKMVKTLSDKKDQFKDMVEKSGFAFSESNDPKVNFNELDSIIEQLNVDESMERSPLKGAFEAYLFNEAAAEEEKTFDYVNGESECHYRYGFTNSEFLAFIASLDPIEYFIVIVILSIIIYRNFNLLELELIFLFLNNFTDAVEIIIDQALFQQTLKEEAEAEEHKHALQEDFTYLNNKIIELQETIKQLEKKLDEP